MPLNCKKCGWAQDHFWTEHYNPITVLERAYKVTLLRDDLDALVLDYPVASHAITRREFVAQELERAASKVRTMRVGTRAELEWIGLDKFGCPDCGLAGLEMD